MSATSSNLSGYSQQANGIGSLLVELVNKLGEYLQTQLALTKAEVQQASQRYLLAGIMGLAAGAVAWLALLFLGLSLFFLLSHYWDVAWAALATTGFYAICAGLLLGGVIYEIRKRQA